MGVAAERDGARSGPRLRGLERFGRSFNIAAKIEPDPGVSPWERFGPVLSCGYFPFRVASRYDASLFPTPYPWYSPSAGEPSSMFVVLSNLTSAMIDSFSLT